MQSNLEISIIQGQACDNCWRAGAVRGYCLDHRHKDIFTRKIRPLCLCTRELKDHERFGHEVIWVKGRYAKREETQHGERVTTK